MTTIKPTIFQRTALVCLMVIASACALAQTPGESADSKTEASANRGNAVRKPDVMPVFPSDLPNDPEGLQALMSYVISNIKYPEIARNFGLSKRVIVSFVVNTNGKVRDVEIVKSEMLSKDPAFLTVQQVLEFKAADDALDEEALRVVKNMPKWKPGMANGKKVKVRQHLPITFKME